MLTDFLLPNFATRALVAEGVNEQLSVPTDYSTKAMLMKDWIFALAEDNVSKLDVKCMLRINAFRRGRSSAQ